jgi:PTH1 family peptidyl-tRNA hydrolase
LIVGLGNPGAQYARNRHNIGFLAVDALAARLGATWQKRPNLELAEARVGAGKLYLMKPQTFMNLSGAAVVPFARFHKLEPSELLIVCDDLDLPFGRLRVRVGGSSGGQNGLKDIAQKLATEHFPRLKLGISRPPPEWTVVNWVLSNFRPDEQPLLEDVILAAVDAATLIAHEGAQTAQNRVNGLDLRPKPPAPPKPAEAEPDTKASSTATSSTEV